MKTSSNTKLFRMLPFAAAFAMAVGTSGAYAAEAVTPTRNDSRLYVVVPSSEPANITGPSTINVYDPVTLELLKQTAPRGLKPHHFYKVPNRPYAFISHFAPTSYVEVFDLSKEEVVATIPTGLGPRHLGFTPDGDYAYSANLDDSTVTRIDIKTFKSITAPAGGLKPNYAEYIQTPKGAYVFSANLGENSVTVLDPITLALVKKITVGAGPFNLAHSDACECIMSANAVDNTVSWIDMNTLEEIDRVSILTPNTVLNTSQTQRLNPRISPDGKFLWVGNQQGSEFAVFDLFTRKLVTVIPAGFGADIAFFPSSGPGAGYVFGTNRYDWKVTVAKLNGPNPPTLVKQMPVSHQGTHYFYFNEDSTKGYVSERPGGGCSVIDMATQTEIQNLYTGGGPDQCNYVPGSERSMPGNVEGRPAK